MSRLLTEIRNEVTGIIKDKDGYIEPLEIDAAIRRGVNRLSECRPRGIIQDFTGDGSATVFEMPTTYVRSKSILLRVMYPFDVTGASDYDDYDIEEQMLFDQGAGTYKLRLSFTPTDASVVRVIFSGIHSVTDSDTTIENENDEDSLIYWAAAECFSIMEARAVGVGDSILGADVVSYQSRSSMYQSLAKKYRELSGLENVAAVAFASANPINSDGCADITH